MAEFLESQIFSDPRRLTNLPADVLSRLVSLNQKGPTPLSPGAEHCLVGHLLIKIASDRRYASALSGLSLASLSAPQLKTLFQTIPSSPRLFPELFQTATDRFISFNAAFSELVHRVDTMIDESRRRSSRAPLTPQKQLFTMPPIKR
jgi:hypothetical protein